MLTVCAHIKSAKAAHCDTGTIFAKVHGLCTRPKCNLLKGNIFFGREAIKHHSLNSPELAPLTFFGTLTGTLAFLLRYFISNPVGSL